MDPLDLARLDDDGSMRRSRIDTLGGSPAGPSTASPEVLPEAPVLRLVRTDAAAPVPASLELVALGSALEVSAASLAAGWPLPVQPARRSSGATGSSDWPLPVEAADDAAAERFVDAVAGGRRSESTPHAVVAAVAAGRGARHRRPVESSRRPSRYLAAAMVGAAGLALTSAGAHTAAPAHAAEPVSIAEELGLEEPGRPTLSGQAATSRLRDLVATRAEREDAQVAAAQAQAEADQVAAEAAAAAAAEAARPKAVLPVQGARLTSGFGYRWGTLHAGVDFAAPLGTPEYAVMDGVVLQAGPASGYGLAVYIQHPDGDVTVYGHMQEILVAEGQTVRAGDTIALLGNTGQSTGPHLHFEVHRGGLDGEKVDPLPWLRDRGVDV
ncbi:M23 family metallopeptidase [Modestobacter roseus]|nr:M23 family metallopeptidase [Modestobacter roseus]